MIGGRFCHNPGGRRKRNCPRCKPTGAGPIGTNGVLAYGYLTVRDRAIPRTSVFPQAKPKQWSVCTRPRLKPRNAQVWWEWWGKSCELVMQIWSCLAHAQLIRESQRDLSSSWRENKQVKTTALVSKYVSLLFAKFLLIVQTCGSHWSFKSVHTNYLCICCI